MMLEVVQVNTCSWKFNKVHFRYAFSLLSFIKDMLFVSFPPWAIQNTLNEINMIASYEELRTEAALKTNA
jgi:hypothetical protein